MGDFPSKHQPGSSRRSGYAHQIDLSNAVTAVTAAATGLDTFTVPAKMGVNALGHALVVGDITFTLDALGTGASGGSWTLQITRVSDGAAVGQGKIAYNATVKVATVDCRNVNGVGVTLAPGDSLRLDVAGVPTGTISAGATGFKAHATAKHFGYDA